LSILDNLSFPILKTGKSLDLKSTANNIENNPSFHQKRHIRTKDVEKTKRKIKESEAQFCKKLNGRGQVCV